MLYVVAVEDGKLYGAAYAVVGTEGCALGCEPFAVDVGLDGIFREVDINIDELVAHHVHVALKDEGGAAFLALGCGLAYDDVSCLVDLCL